MSEWFVARQLVGLPGLPSTVQALNRLAKRENWLVRIREGRAHEREYHASSLTPETRARLAQALVDEVVRAGQLAAAKLDLQERLQARAADACREESLRSVGLADGWTGREIDARVAILAAFDSWRAACGVALTDARVMFASAYNAGQIEVTPEVRTAVPTLSRATLCRWASGLQQYGLQALAPRYGNRSGASAIASDGELREFVLSLLAAKPHTSAANLYTACKARFKGRMQVSRRTLERYIERWKAEHGQLFTAVTNPDAWKSRYMSAFGSASEHVQRLNQLWELDSTPGDVMLTDGRHNLIGVVDVYTRRARILVAKTSKAVSVATLMRRALLDWGVPESAKTDGGAEYVSRHLRRVFADLSVTHLECAPFSPWEKPHVERFFRTFSHGLVELLDGFVGHNVAERQDIEARRSFAQRLFQKDATVELLMSAQELQGFCDRWCEDLYHHEAHEGLNGMTPFAVAAAWPEQPRRIHDERALDVLLAAPAGNGQRIVQKKGIALDGAWFIAPELALHVGDAVDVRIDPQDLGRLYVYRDAAFLCIAECPERTGMDRQEVATRARTLQRERIQEERAALKAAGKRANTDDIVREILTDRAAAAGKLARLPVREVELPVPGLQQAKRAVQHGRAPAAQMSDAQRALLERMRDEHAQTPATVTKLPDREVRFRRWLDVDTRLKASQAVSDTDRQFWAGYQTVPEFDAQRMLWEAREQLRAVGE
ncbi:MAG: transposase [Burkholderiales bacterium]|nr:transposase [Burkholderiales bacterium]